MSALGRHPAQISVPWRHAVSPARSNASPTTERSSKRKADQGQGGARQPLASMSARTRDRTGIRRALRRKGSTSFEPLMKQIGASFLERKYAASVALEATLHQTELVMTTAARGPGF